MEQQSLLSKAISACAASLFEPLARWRDGPIVTPGSIGHWGWPPNAGEKYHSDAGLTLRVAPGSRIRIKENCLSYEGPARDADAAAFVGLSFLVNRSEGVVTAEGSEAFKLSAWAHAWHMDFYISNYLPENMHNEGPAMQHARRIRENYDMADIRLPRYVAPNPITSEAQMMNYCWRRRRLDMLEFDYE